ncbi:MAG: hypothetical protein LCH81_15380 [Bacteroidetes bacterium]|nr:hypothetical protein [Bacteroidota bacterium]
MAIKGVFIFQMIVMSCVLQAQTTIRIQNASFEWDTPTAGMAPGGWIDMGAAGETPSDIQPGWFGVKMEAQDGKNYVGMVVRDNNTWEGIGQKLNGWIRKDSAYTFSVWLARSNTYQSVSRMTGEEVNYKNPTILKIWGVNTRTGDEELLAESTAVGHSVWTRYTFTLAPFKSDYDEIDLMAYYAPGSEGKSGNLLIDNCSDIVEVKK